MRSSAWPTTAPFFPPPCGERGPCEAWWEGGLRIEVRGLSTSIPVELASPAASSGRPPAHQLCWSSRPARGREEGSHAAEIA